MPKIYENIIFLAEFADFSQKDYCELTCIFPPVTTCGPVYKVIPEITMFLLTKRNNFSISDTFIEFLSRQHNQSFIKGTGVILLGIMMLDNI